jgi:peptidoglycan/LPS O-acetylase OafA/YrhL
VLSFYQFWYVGVILLYYLLYPLLVRYSSNSVPKLVLISAAIFLTFALVRVILQTIDIRFFLYYFVFVGGIASSIVANRFDVLARIDKNRPFIIMASALSLAVFLYVYLILIENTKALDVGAAPLVSIFGLVSFFVLNVMMLLFALFVYCLAGYAIRSRALLPAFQLVSYASYSIFLFHVLILAGLATVLTRIVNAGLLEKDLLIIVIGLPAACLIPYAIQRITDAGFSQLGASRSNN